MVGWARPYAAARASLSRLVRTSYAPSASGGTADALASGASVRKDVGVQIPPRAPVRTQADLGFIWNHRQSSLHK
jgi:hypothetical protein